LKSRRVTILIISVLLGVAIIAVIFTAIGTVRAVQSLQHQHTLAKAGDVSTIRPWMTLPYVAHNYHVPESYLYNSLRIPDTRNSHHMPLQALASHYNRPVDSVVHDIQNAVILYRKQHPHHSSNKPSRKETPTTSWHGTTGGQVH
jgi:hypothetical protein